MSTLSRSAVVCLALALSVGACGGGGTSEPPPPPPPPPPSPANLIKEAGDNQTAEPGQAVAVPPKVKVTSATGTPVPGVTVTFAVASGAGSVTGATPATGSDGIATLGSWTLGATSGANTLTALVSGAGVSGNPATFSANAQFAAFNPAANTTLSGTRDFSSLNIPAGVTVTVTGPLLIRVTGAASIAGTLIGDCTSIEVRVTGNLTVDGLIRNTCTAPPADPPGIKLLADGDLIIGTTVSNQDAIVTDGSIRITDTGTENLNILPLVVFPSASQMKGSGATVRIPSAPAHVSRVGRPMRAGRGKDVTQTRDGPIDIAGALDAGNGADAVAKTLAGVCDNSLAIGGTGGRIQLVARNSTLTFKTGSSAKSGDGGKGGSCTSPSGCPSSAVAGKGGTGGSILLGATTIVFEANVRLIRGNGGVGGGAESDADDGPAACANGCDATATGGEGGTIGGIGYAVLSPGTVTGTPTEEGGDGGTGGLGDATGGDGKDCNVCPAGKGGNGGSGTATGGRGGNGATGNVWPVAPASHRKGNGGNSLAVAGVGGKGATCCTPPTAGGNGGDGGTATSTAGQPGSAGLGGGGTRGVDAGFGGDGGAGGAPGGSGGALGVGNGDPDDILDGDPGPPGGVCPLPAAFSLALTPSSDTKARGTTGMVRATGTRTGGFTGLINLELRRPDNSIVATGSIPPANSFFDIFYSIPMNELLGQSNWFVRGTATGAPNFDAPFLMTVTTPPPAQPDEVRVLIQPPGVQGSVAPGTYTANLQDIVSGAIVGTALVKAKGPGGTFRADNPTRTGAGVNGKWADVIGSAIVNGAAYVIGKVKQCIINAPTVNSTNSLKVNHLNKSGATTKTTVVTGEGCIEEDVQDDDDEIETTGPEKSGFQDSRSKHYRRKGALSPAPAPVRRP